MTFPQFGKGHYFLGREVMKIYCTKPMKGCSFEAVVEYYNEIQGILEDMGWVFLNPMCGKNYLAGEKSFKNSGYTQPLSNDQAIVERDRWMVKQSDVLLVNLLGTKEVSIGSMFEMSWGYDCGKHIVTVMENDSIHYHAFTLKCSHVLYNNLGEAIDYLGKLIKSEI